MLKQELILANKLSKQRKQLLENISALKTKEYEERSKCNCKGYCNINHAKKRWFKSKASNVELEFKSFKNVLTLKCHACDFESISEDDFKKHIIDKHEFKCEKCNFVTKTETDLAKHRAMKHKERVLKSILKNKIG